MPEIDQRQQFLLVIQHNVNHIGLICIFLFGRFQFILEQHHITFGIP